MSIAIKSFRWFVKEKLLARLRRNKSKLEWPSKMSSERRLKPYSSQPPTHLTDLLRYALKLQLTVTLRLCRLSLGCVASMDCQIYRRKSCLIKSRKSLYGLRSYKPLKRTLLLEPKSEFLLNLPNRLLKSHL